MTFDAWLMKRGITLKEFDFMLSARQTELLCLYNQENMDAAAYIRTLEAEAAYDAAEKAQEAIAAADAAYAKYRTAVDAAKNAAYEAHIDAASYAKYRKAIDAAKEAAVIGQRD